VPDQLNYRRVGHGPPLLLIHGLGSDLNVWDPVVESLSGDFELIRVDMPGFGDSPPLAYGVVPTPVALAARIGEFLDQLGLTGAHVVGNSLGGWVALELALLGRARTVTALCPAGLWRIPPAQNDPGPTDGTQRAARLVKPLIPLAMRVAPIRHAALSAFVFHPERVPVKSATQMAMAYAGSEGYSASSAAMRANRFIGVDELSVPTVIAWAEHDRLLRSHELSTSCVRTVHLPDCGHTPMWDQPQLVAELIRNTARSS
jgi:pimeloyl-ACP methyl ester carboxylesterase